jgi:hypothetical protein
MSHDLKARLHRYRNTGKAPAAQEKVHYSPELLSDAVWPLWVKAGYKTIKREFSCELPFRFPGAFSGALPIIVPDFYRLGRLPLAEELFFFDLETTGLSGGAGTIAFLAAIGRFDNSAKYNGNAALVITQYLLLDYPGEYDFIGSVTSDLARQPIMVSYNGKCFDSQILKNRCLMNRIKPPEYFHADLLHPSRRLWKRILPDCSQSTIEISVLGLDRTGDVSGAMAPEIWFSFLKTGDNRELLRVCDHNLKDICGLASLFLALTEIAADPFESRIKFRFNEEALALSWWKAIKKTPEFFRDNNSCSNYAKTGELLLEAAAKNGSYLAAI